VDGGRRLAGSALFIGEDDEVRLRVRHRTLITPCLSL
jgi:hypothetical protein